MITQDYIFTFGKYKGYTLKSMTVFNSHVNYIYWCVVNVKWFKFPTNEQLEELKKTTILKMV